MGARILCLTMLAALGARGEIIDRIAVTVGKQVIAESDVLRDIRVSAFLDQKPVDLSGSEKRKAADRLVDQLLILQEAAFSKIPLAVESDAANMLGSVKTLYGADYAAALARYGITEADVVNHLAAGARAMRFTDLRFRPEVEITDDDVSDYYSTLLEEWRKQGETKIPTLDSIRDKVSEMVTNQRIGQALDRWLGAQRTQSTILYHDQVFR